MNRVKITIDNYGLKSMNNNKEISFKSIFTKKAMNMRENKELGRSFKTDGYQVILQYIDIKVEKQTGSLEAARKRIWFDTKIYKKLIQWREKGRKDKLTPDLRS